MPKRSPTTRSTGNFIGRMSRRTDTESTADDSFHVQLRHHLSRLPRVVSAQARKLAAAGAPLEGLHDPARARVGAPLLRKDEVEPFLGEGDEVEAVGNRRAPR